MMDVTIVTPWSHLIGAFAIAFVCGMGAGLNFGLWFAARVVREKVLQAEGTTGVERLRQSLLRPSR